MQQVYDFALAPVRMVLLPDRASERLHLTSLRAERLAAALPELHGRCLDVGAGDNALIRLYLRETAGADPGNDSLGVDVHEWGGGCRLIRSAAALPFPDASFDTVSFIACLNHIPERSEALCEARRVLRPGGRLVVSMIGRFIGRIGHAIWWYSEDKHRHVAEEEEMGLDHSEVVGLIRAAGFAPPRIVRFLYGLNRIYVAERDG